MLRYLIPAALVALGASWLAFELAGALQRASALIGGAGL